MNAKSLHRLSCMRRRPSIRHVEARKQFGINRENISVRHCDFGLTLACMSLLSAHSNPSWPGLTRPSIARASASDGVSSTQRFANTRSRARYPPDGWLPRWAAMRTEGHTTVRTTCEGCDFKCASHPQTATSRVVANGRGDPVPIFRKTKRTIPSRMGLAGTPPPFSGGSNGNFGAQGRGGKRENPKNNNQDHAVKQKRWSTGCAASPSRSPTWGYSE
jgi:hypothetical protein